MPAFEVIPRGRHTTASLTRRGAAAGTSGIILLSLSLLTNVPLVLLVLVSVGGLLILAACLAGAAVAVFSPFREER